MQKNSRVFVAGHRGLVGSALLRKLQQQEYSRILTRTHDQLDLSDPIAVDKYFNENKPEFVFLAAAKVGGIAANNNFPADFILQNLKIQNAVIEASHKHGVQRFLFLGSSCIYPKLAPQPMGEESLLTGPLESTNRPYAIAKIAGIELCWSFNRQFGTQFLAVMPTNLYGPADNYDLQNSHVLPALIRKFHEAKKMKSPFVEVWGTGTPKREFLFSDDLAEACCFLMSLPDSKFKPLVEASQCPLINVGVGEDLTITEIAQIVKKIVGYEGEVKLDPSKPDGTPRKLMKIEKMRSLGWRAKTNLDSGIKISYQDFLERGL